jgi:hypothetical protein
MALFDWSSLGVDGCSRITREDGAILFPLWEDFDQFERTQILRMSKIEQKSENIVLLGFEPEFKHICRIFQFLKSALDASHVGGFAYDFVNLHLCAQDMKSFKYPVYSVDRCPYHDVKCFHSRFDPKFISKKPHAIVTLWLIRVTMSDARDISCYQNTFRFSGFRLLNVWSCSDYDGQLNYACRNWNFRTQLEPDVRIGHKEFQTLSRLKNVLRLGGGSGNGGSLQTKTVSVFSSTASVLNFDRRKSVVNGVIVDHLQISFSTQIVSTRRWIPATIHVLTSLSASEHSPIDLIVFETGSQLQEIRIPLCKLRYIMIPSSVEVICKSCFSNWIFKSITFENGSQLRRLEKSLFSWSGLSSIAIPSSVEIICKSCFANCTLLESVSFQNMPKLRKLGERAFSTSGLKSIIIPSSIEIICKSCFEECKSLQSIFFENVSKLQRLGERAFSSTGLRSVIIPSSVEIICKSCFEECKSLESILFENISHLRRLEGRAF